MSANLDPRPRERDSWEYEVDWCIQLMSYGSIDVPTVKMTGSAGTLRSFVNGQQHSGEFGVRFNDLLRRSKCYEGKDAVSIIRHGPVQILHHLN